MGTIISVVAHFVAAGILGMYWVDAKKYNGWDFFGAMWRLCLIIFLFGV